MKKMLIYALLFGAASLLFTQPVSAIGLKVAPLLYNETLQTGETKKAYIDVSNPDDQTRVVTVEVAGFTQINNNGELSFFKAPEYAGGIKPDYTQFTLGPREALRLYFVMDSKKLPKGGVYGVVFFKTSPAGANPDQTSIQTEVKVGTLLIIENGGGGTKDSTLTRVDAPFFQFGKAVRATALVKNSESPTSIAFFPEIQLQVQPFGRQKELESPLVFPGNTRRTVITATGSHFGLVRLRVSTGSTTKFKWAFVATGGGRIAGPALVVVAFGLATGLVYIRRRSRRTGTSVNQSKK